MLSERTIRRLRDVLDDAARIGPGLPVAQMRAPGNRLRHEYFDVNCAILFDIAVREVMVLRASVELALEQE